MFQSSKSNLLNSDEGNLNLLHKLQDEFQSSKSNLLNSDGAYCLGLDKESFQVSIKQVQLTQFWRKCIHIRYAIKA